MSYTLLQKAIYRPGPPVDWVNSRSKVARAKA